MTINRAKCGILCMKGNMKDREIEGIPVVNSYKYLGFQLNKDFKAANHLSETARKVNAFTSMMYPIRRHDNLRINRNLFELYLLPNYRLAIPVYEFLDTPEKEKFVREIKTKWKRFCRLPITLANHTA